LAAKAGDVDIGDGAATRFRASRVDPVQLCSYVGWVRRAAGTHQFRGRFRLGKPGSMSFCFAINPSYSNVMVGVRGNQIVPRQICVRLVARNAMHQKMAEDKELGTFRFKFRVLSRHSITA